MASSVDLMNTNSLLSVMILLSFFVYLKISDILENVYEMLGVSKILHGVEVWVLVGRWKEVGKIHKRFCNETLGLPQICRKL
jgi:hypothetical protein